MPKPSVVLVVMARDEEAIIERCLLSARDQVDAWLLVDTGSTDRTVEIARRAMSNVPGTVARVPWKGFGPTRTAALELAPRFGDFALMLDADQALRGELGPLDPAVCAYDLTVQEAGTTWRIPRLTRCGLRWRYVGSTHEYLRLDSPVDSHVIALEQPVIVHHADGASRSDKLQRDRSLLQADLDAGREPERSCFYLAQTLEGLGDKQAARDLYLQRAAMPGGWHEERWFARFTAALLSPDQEAEMREAAAMRPARPEPWYWLALCARERGDARAALEAADRGLAVVPCADALFVARWMEEYGLHFERAAALAVLGQLADARALFSRLVDREDVAESWQKAALHNLDVLRRSSVATA